MDKLLLGAIFVPLLGSLGCLLFPGKLKKIWSFLITLLPFIFVGFLLFSLLEGQKIWFKFPLFNSEFLSLSLVADPLGVIFSLLFLFVGMVSLIYSFTYIKEYESEYYFMTTLLFGALVGVVFSLNLIFLYLFWEIAALGTWRLVGFYRGEKEVRMANKAFLFIFLGSSFMLLGFIFLYQKMGTLNLDTLRGKEPVSFILLLILAGILAKSATLPLQIWVPHAYPTAPSSINAILSAMVDNLGIFAFLRIFYWTFNYSWVWLGWLVVISSLVAGGAAFIEKDTKRILAYSTISQLGFIFLGFTLLTKFGIVAGITYFVAHSIAKAGLFLGVGVVEENTGERNLKNLGGLMRRMPLTGVGFLFSSLSLVGIPPFFGFYPKFLLILGTVKSGSPWLASFLVLSAIFTLLYSFRLFNGIFLGKEKFTGVKEKTKSMVGCVLFLGLISLLLGFLVAPLIGFSSLALAWGLR